MPKKNQKKKGKGKSKSRVGSGDCLARRQVEVAAPIVGERAMEVQEDNRAWDEKDDDSDLDVISYVEEVSEGKKGRKKRRDGQGQDLDFTEGFTLPLDIWFLISEKIQPEEVGRFGAICQATYYVVSTARFWFSLFRRYYSWTAHLPEYLTYHKMNNVRGLKPAVIRSLFYTYTPFSTRLSKEKPLSGHPAKLVGAECISQWHKKVGSYQKYSFMFATPIRKKRRKRNAHDPANSPTDTLVHINPDEGCYILETVSSGVCHVPVVLGNHLHSGHLGLSTGFCSHRLQLTLSPAYLIPKNNGKMHHRFLPASESFQVILEPVRDVRIYPWWHPKYQKGLP